MALRTLSSTGKISAQRKTSKEKSRTSFSLIFHPGVLGLTVLLGLLSFRLCTIANTRVLGHKVKGNQTIQTRISKEAELRTDAHNVNGSVFKQHRAKRSPSHYGKYRPIPQTPLDDMLLDAETPVPADQCLKQNTLKWLEDTETKLIGKRKTLNEHLEPCASSDDCLQVSPYMWQTEGSGEPCRKRTHLRCNSTEHRCVCKDRMDLRWDTEMPEQSAFQWNPITKTCYVRGTMPCKLEIPCSPGTTCRSMVSFSYNVPPIQRICDCTDINLLINADNEDWWDDTTLSNKWFCKTYWKRIWVYDMDNVNRWNLEQPHIYNYFQIKHVET